VIPPPPPVVDAISSDPLLWFVESFDGLGLLTIKFNKPLEPLPLELLEEITSITIDPFEAALRGYDPLKFQFEWEAISMSPSDGRLVY
jgi:hypothetical protein